MTDLSLVLVEELLSSSKTLFLTLHALPSLPHTPRNTSGYGFPSTPTSCLYVYKPAHVQAHLKFANDHLDDP